MHEVYQAMEQMFSCGLYSSYSSAFQYIDTSNLTKIEALNLNIYQATSLKNLQDFHRAESVYHNVLQLMKQLTAKQKSRSENNESLYQNENEIKYSLYECYVALGQTNAAINQLQNIPPKHRDKKVYHALGSLYSKTGLDHPASAAYKEVLKECPLALDAIVALLKLGMSTKEIQDIAASGGKLPTSESTWYHSYINTQATLYGKDFKACVKECRNLEDKQEFQGCVDVLLTCGLAHAYAGEYEEARILLQRAYSNDNFLFQGMDTLASILYRTNKVAELESHSAKLMNTSDQRAESWVAIGYYCHLNKNFKRAVYFAHKACQIDPRNIEALLLKGNIFLDLKKYRDATNHFREALQLAPYRLEAHQGIVECYIGSQRHREAANAATEACKQFNNSPRALTLYATALLKEPLVIGRAKPLLERAAETGYLPAVYLLVDLLEREGAQEKAVAYIKKNLEHETSGRLYQMLGDLLLKQGKEAEAMEQFSLALSMNPQDDLALAGLQRIEAANDGVGGVGLEASYDLEMTEVASNNESSMVGVVVSGGGGGSEGSGGGIPGSRGRGIVSPSPGSRVGGDLGEDSETEAVWSDGDLNIIGGS
eukprot:TRINITY_DN2819_c0_g1_i6.p1 TRINITY_DN2819_c0_g1~~TRINITY_DN2819_c0_g1_i6.p1  ORF type:complete len:621 (-),score=127.59 TRINITY_DN2819_c0_g1_i6:384-2177(-)